MTVADLRLAAPPSPGTYDARMGATCEPGGWCSAPMIQPLGRRTGVFGGLEHGKQMKEFVSWRVMR